MTKTDLQVLKVLIHAGVHPMEALQAIRATQ
jgi:hypothetical protein